MKSFDQNAERVENQTNEAVIPFNDYMAKVEETFVMNSKMYVLSRLYQHVTVRDDQHVISMRQ